MIATASTAAAIAANQRVNETCKGVVAYYDAATASVAQMQAYAACVQRLYPAEMWVDLWVLKGTVAFLLLSMVAGFIAPVGGSWLSRITCALFYPIAGACAIFVCVLVILGVRFLIS